MTNVSNESGLIDVGRLNKNLMIGYRKIEKAEHRSTNKRVECLIESGQRETVEHRYGVETAVMDAHPPFAVFFRPITTGDAYGNVEGCAI